MRDYKFL